VTDLINLILKGAMKMKKSIYGVVIFIVLYCAYYMSGIGESAGQKTCWTLENAATESGSYGPEIASLIDEHMVKDMVDPEYNWTLAENWNEHATLLGIQCNNYKGSENVTEVRTWMARIITGTLEGMKNRK
jgi:hypothetical protein